MRLKELLNVGIQTLREKKIEDSDMKAKVLLEFLLKQDRNYLLVNSDKEISKQDENKYKKWIRELSEGRPLQYITNHQEFMGIDFYVDENVLIPQPDTEILVEEALKEINKKILEENCTVRILDLCTGSGVIAISLAKFLQKKENHGIQFKIYATDISQEALKVAEKNARQHNVSIHFILSNMFENIQKFVKEGFDIIISNPPYIETKTIHNLSREVQHEPHLALDGGKDGLVFYRIIAGNSKQFLKEAGILLIEIGYQQKESVTSLFKIEKQYTHINCVKDLAGNDRVLKLYD